ncbi:hypothetical protein TIFTF001_005383 [Ficus carica]|uniref:Uncharacterized protein n=1 Tax=Ficus carica TaxID=3494 RepID=A0AA88CXH8_FICCA|nr:hypothetical protein TIFTF001_005383 [Ficus carica]
MGWVLGLRSANGERSLISSADDALSDLRTLVYLDENRCLVLYTLRFLANCVAVCFVIVLGFRPLFLSPLHAPLLRLSQRCGGTGVSEGKR